MAKVAFIFLVLSTSTEWFQNIQARFARVEWNGLRYSIEELSNLGLQIEDVIDELSVISNVTANSDDEKGSTRNKYFGEEFPQPEGRILYRGNQLWKTVVDSEDKVEALIKLRDAEDITMWGGNASAIDILVKPESIEKVKNALKSQNINFDVAIEDLQTAIDEENPPIDETQIRDGHSLTWYAYHRLEDLHGYLDYLAATYKDIVTLETIGTSINGRLIKLLKISNKQPGNKAAWVDGGIHAREWITPATVTYIINQLILNWESEPKYIQNIDWYFVPLLNPDGYEYTHSTDRLWRKNRRGSGRCAGVDLNRNFGYRWGGTGSSKNPCAETFGGSGPFSEPETAAVQRYISGSSAKWKAYISFHSYGQYILYPWGYNRVVPPDYKDLELVGQKVAKAIRMVGGPMYTVGPAGNTLYPAAGGSDDWAKGTMKIKYAYTIELRDNGRYGFVLPASYIQPTAKEALAAVRTIAEAVASA
ncbi:carboxypeptidase B-like [Euwallacea fornicatus]|uniref:carboxypeptidase B-like n=1 Tax=Euwallacea fornicatus TaxID=995702 RepID=UPI00338E7FEF